MSRRPHYAQKRHRGWLLILIILLIVGAWFYTRSVNIDKIIDNSILKGRTSNAKVEEIIAPDSGIKAYFIHNNENPIISMEFIFADSGSAYDADNKKGLANLSAQMLTEGAGNLDDFHFKEELEKYAIDINYSVDKDDFSGRLLTIKDNLPRAIELLRQTLFEPRIEYNALQRVQQQTLQKIARLRESPSGRLKEAVSGKIFKHHGYGTSVLGTIEGVKSIKAADISDFLSRNFTKDKLFIGIAGDISKTEAEQLIDKIFSALPNERKSKDISSPSVDFSFRIENIEDKAAPQILSTIIAPSVSRLDKDFYPLYIANYIFGGAGLNSRINQSAREKEGLTYGAYTGLSLLQKSPHLVGGFSTTPDNFARMQEIFINEWNIMGQKGISNKELKFAKNYLQSSYNLRFDDISSLASILANMQRQDLGADFLQKRNIYIEKVTLERVNKVAKQYFSPEKLVIINLGAKLNERNGNEQTDK